MSTSKSNATAPAILSIRDSKGEVPQGGVTPDTTVTVAGRAEPTKKVEVRDGTVSKGTAHADAAGNWLLALSGLTVGVHSITASTDGAVSAARTFSVVQQ
ncbi:MULTISPECIES: hypothetical protein [unclassified Pseudomonas]|uniref:hypothetical protein n=1 Tax=unclassified Pseudomonas TaxID=196821 RepID=UPI000A1F414D|nr:MULTISPECIES: hypothetical protein [unclassified Pseudomonas]MDI2142641.1 hypothetical protein [Pseudomonas sp. ITA]